MPQNKPIGNLFATILFLLIVVLMILVARFHLVSSTGGSYVLLVVLCSAFIAVLGVSITGRAFGAIISERNLMSLSRFQMLVWTVILVPAYLLAAIQRIVSEAPDPLAIGIDPNLWGLLGIGTASLIGSPLILSSKKNKEPAGNAVAKAEKSLARLGEAPGAVEANREGILYANSAYADARFSDMFQGDELDNTASIDLSKVQMFFFTIAAALAYASGLVAWFNTTTPDIYKNFPVVSPGLLAILGISHAGYLGTKAVDHTKVQ